jgi:SAM-dependent methyltransferase
MNKKKAPDAPYDCFIADYYDSTPILVHRTRDVAFYLDAVKKYGQSVLELGCGTGRVTIPIAKAGFRVVGLDLSARMLERAIEKRDTLKPFVQDRVHLIQGDMTRFELDEKFRTVIIPFRPFQDLTETKQQIACLECARKHMEPDGRLILDVFQMDADRMFDQKFREESLLLEYDLPDGRHVAISERVKAFHRAEQKNDVEMIFDVTHPSGREGRMVMAWTLRYFFRYELEHLLTRCGFKVEAVYGDFDSSPLGDNSPEMIFVAAAS